MCKYLDRGMIINNVKLLSKTGKSEILLESKMFNKVLISLITIIIIFFVYILFIFDVNNYKADLEQIISEKANVELRISGELSLNLGINSTLNAESYLLERIIF